MTDTRGVPRLTAESRFVGKRKTFFSPIFTFFPALSSLRTFRLWPGGASAVGPVNTARSYGGVQVTPELALQLSAVWACVWRYANTVSTLPLDVMETGPQNSAIKAPKHPLYVMLHDRPNANMSASKYWQSQMASMMTWGFCVAEKQFIGSRLVALDPWRPEFVTTYLDASKKLRYRYWPNAGPGNPMGTNRDVSAEEVFVVLDRSMDGLTGLSRIQYGANSMGLAMAADRAANLSYKNGLRASGILSIAQWLKPDQRAAYKTIVNDFVGTGVGDDTDKQYGVMVAENATKFDQISMRPADVELLASRQYSVEDLCRWYDMPPILIGHASQGQTMWGSGVEQIILGWFKLGLLPLLVTIKQEIWRQVLSPEDRAGGLFAEFNMDALLQGDSQARANFISTMTQNGIYTRNEVRAWENKPAKEGGDELTVQSSMTLLTMLGKEPAPGANPANALKQMLGVMTPEDIVKIVKQVMAESKPL